MPTQASTQAPAQATTQVPTQAPPGQSIACGTCTGCLWSSGTCYSDVDASYCNMWSANSWCGGSSLAQVARGQVKRHSNFRGVAMIQEGVVVERLREDRPSSDEL